MSDNINRTQHIQYKEYFKNFHFLILTLREQQRLSSWQQILTCPLLPKKKLSLNFTSAIKFKKIVSHKLKIQKLFFFFFFFFYAGSTLRDIWNDNFGGVHWNGSVSLLLIPVLRHCSEKLSRLFFFFRWLWSLGKNPSLMKGPKWAS